MRDARPQQPRRFKPYPAYTSFGEGALSSLPTHWATKRLKFLAAEPIKNGIGEPGAHDNREWPRYVRITDIAGPRALRHDTFKSLPPELAREATFRRGDMLLAAVGATFGKSYLHIQDCGPMCFAGYMVRFSPSPLITPEFASYWTESSAYWALVQSRVVQATIPNFSAAKYKDLAVPLPSIGEQRSIVEFLDRETARVDALVRKKEQLIELLQEKRSALVRRAVTKGLAPNAPMKDSGVKWAGTVPNHWEITRTKFAARLRTGHTPSRQEPEYWQSCTIPWFGLADVWQIRDERTEYIYETTEKISELGLANSSARLLPKGTVILSRTASIGFSAILGTDMATTQDFVNWVCGPKLRPEYLLCVFRSMTHEFRRLTMGSTHQTIYMPDVGAFCTPVPPLDEQDQIVTVIRRDAGRIDALIAKVREAIDRLKELRVALVSAAMTGKIDVREEVA
jgi:type I restriction enzyme S subunit